MSKNLRNILTLILLALIWGSSFILMKRVLYTASGEELFSPMALGSLRLVIAGLVLLPIALKNLHILKTKHLLPIAVVGIFGNGVPAFFFAIAETVIPSGLVGVLNSLTPLFVVILGVLVFKSSVNKLMLTGVLIGLIGAVGLIAFQKSESFALDSTYIFYAILVVIATSCYGLSVNTIQHKLKSVDALIIASLGLMLAAIPATVILIGTDFLSVVNTEPDAWKGIGYCAILSAIGTAFALILFNKLVQNSSGVFASMVTYLIPIVAVLWGVLDNESFSLLQVIFGGVILFGVYVVKLGRKNTAD